MSGQVLAQVVGACKALAAHFAMVWPLAGMNAHMTREIAFTTKCSAAEQTSEWSLTGMLAHMQLEVLL